ncbi:hypothetical protein C5Y93_25465 [Blastopirellula marina]|uniref:Uncharacterized protein n=1 Tax=Blastopirellula marina TaxID=124 RepID=A0A2S8GF65_9BACT|nr:hypothetical protein C5Y93_25465 [Blastopirellula marina]
MRIQAPQLTADQARISIADQDRSGNLGMSNLGRMVDRIQRSTAATQKAGASLLAPSECQKADRRLGRRAASYA